MGMFDKIKQTVSDTVVSSSLKQKLNETIDSVKDTLPTKDELTNSFSKSNEKMKNTIHSVVDALPTIEVEDIKTFASDVQFLCNKTSMTVKNSFGNTIDVIGAKFPSGEELKTAIVRQATSIDYDALSKSLHTISKIHPISDKVYQSVNTLGNIATTYKLYDKNDSFIQNITNNIDVFGLIILMRPFIVQSLSGCGLTGGGSAVATSLAANPYVLIGVFVLLLILLIVYMRKNNQSEIAI